MIGDGSSIRWKDEEVQTLARVFLFVLAYSKLVFRLAVDRASAFTVISPSAVSTLESVRHHAFVPSGRRFMTTSSADFQDHHLNNFSGDEKRSSVSGLIYSDDSSPANAVVTVKLFTKQGCSLCDKVKQVLESMRQEQPHTLEAVDITDPDKSDWYHKYKYDIPVLHLNGMYWAKHQLSREQAVECLHAARVGSFVHARPEEEPDAGAMERRQMERRMAEKDAS